MRIKKVLKIILWIIIITVFIFLGGMIRNIVILVKLDNSVTELNNSKENYYKSIKYSENPNWNADLEFYKKGDVVKCITKLKDGSATMTEYSYPNIRRVYTETKEEKIFREEKEFIELSYPVTIENYTNIIDFWHLIVAASNTKIKTVDFEGSKCYELSGNHSPIFLYLGYHDDLVSMKLYLEKDTGIPVRQVETVNIDGEIINYTIDYEFKFDIVTDEDIKEPDVSEYTIFEPQI